MSTMAQLIDRTLRDYLQPLYHQPVTTKLTTANVTDADGQTVNYDAGYLGADEEDLISPGLVVQLHDSSTGNVELCRVATATLASDLFTVTDRGLHGTTASAFTFADSATTITLDPHPSRQAIFDALADAVYGLYPELFQTKTYDIGGTSFEPPTDFVEAISYWTLQSGAYKPTPFRVVETPAGTRILTESAAFGRLEYKARFTRPTAHSDNLTSSFGIVAAWESALVAEAAAIISAGSDIPKLDAEIISDQLNIQGVPIRSAETVSRSLLRLRDSIVSRYSQQLHRSLRRSVSIGGVRIR